MFSFVLTQYNDLCLKNLQWKLCTFYNIFYILIKFLKFLGMWIVLEHMFQLICNLTGNEDYCAWEKFKTGSNLIRFFILDFNICFNLIQILFFYFSFFTVFFQKLEFKNSFKKIFLTKTIFLIDWNLKSVAFQSTHY